MTGHSTETADSEGDTSFRSLLSEGLRNGVYKSKEYHGRGVKVVNMKELFAHDRIDDQPQLRVELSDTELSKFELRPADLIFARRSFVLEGAGKCSLVAHPSEPTVFESSMIRARVDPEKADPVFLYYLFRAPQGRALMATIASRTAVSGIKGSDLSNLRLRLPSLPRQRSASRLLSRIDDLIANNQRRIEVLEEMAGAVYREWFVHFRYPGHENATLVDSSLGPIPTGWHADRLERVAKVNRASRTPADSETIEYLDISVLGDRSVGKLNAVNGADAPGRARRIVSAGDVVWSMVRPNRRAHALLVDPGPNWIASTGLAVLTPKSVSSALLFEAVSTREFSDYLVSQEGGAAYPAVKPKDFEAAMLLVPPPELDRRFEATVACHHELIWTLRAQSAQLAATRDLLLPRLVTGQIDVSSLDLGALIEDSVA